MLQQTVYRLIASIGCLLQFCVVDQQKGSKITKEVFVGQLVALEGKIYSVTSFKRARKINRNILFVLQKSKNQPTKYIINDEHFI